MIHETARIWQPSNVYPKADIGEETQIGAFSEIGPCKIGKRVRIGFNCFIPEGVTIEDDAWIGPRVTMTNDRFPPSEKSNWEQTYIGKGARLGAGVTIVCGVRIGEKALIGAGSTVTKNVPDGETWVGNPAKPIGER